MGVALPRVDNEVIEVRQVQEMSDFPQEIQKARGLPACLDELNDGVIGSLDGYRHPSCDRCGLENRVPETHRESRPDGPRCRCGRRSRSGCARRRARTMAAGRRPQEPGRLAHGRRETSGDRSLPPEQAPRAQAPGTRVRARDRAGPGRARPRCGAGRGRWRRSPAPDVHRLPSGARDRRHASRSRSVCSAASRPTRLRGRSSSRSPLSPSASSGPSARSPKSGCRSRFRAGTIARLASRRSSR